MSAMTTVSVPISIVGEGVVVLPLKEYENNRFGMNYWADESHKMELRVNKLKDALLSCRTRFRALAHRNSAEWKWCEQAILEIHAALGIQRGAFEDDEEEEKE